MTEAELADFLAAPRRPPHSLDLDGLDGYLFALACWDPLPASRWFPPIFADAPPAFADAAETRRVLDALTARHDGHGQAVVAGPWRLPPRCTPRAPAARNFAADAPLARWSRGFARGHGLACPASTTDAADAALAAAVLALGVFGAPAAQARLVDQRRRREPARGEDELREAVAAHCCARLAPALAAYVQAARARR